MKKNRFSNKIAFLVILLIVTLCGPAHADAPRISVITPGHENQEGFWRISHRMMDVVAASLGIELAFSYSYGDPHLMSQLVDELIINEDLPDYAVLVGFKGATLNLIRKLNNAKIKTAIFNGPLSERQQRRFNNGEGMDYWVGSLIPDEQQAGYILAKNLIEEARKKNLQNKDSKMGVCAITGAKRSPVSDARIAGLKKYAKEHSDVDIRDIKVADWKRDYANTLTFEHLAANDDTSVIWSASDSMAMGAIQAAKEIAKVPGENIISGGIDWYSEAFPAIEKQELHGSVGGHFYDGAWILVALYDHFNGKLDSGFDFLTEFSFVDDKNLAVVAKASDLETLKQVDFKQWTKTHGYTGDYNFGAKLLLDEIETNH